MNKIRRDFADLLFTPQPATPLALFRIAFGLLMLAWCVLMGPELKLWYGEGGLFNLAAMHAWEPNSPGFDLLAMRTWCHATFGVWLFTDVSDYGVTVALFVLLILSALCVTIGFKTRTASILMWLLVVSFQHRDTLMLNGGDDVQRNMAFLLMFANSGAACSVDRLIRIARGEVSADAAPMVEPWAIRLMQLQVAAIYLATVCCKSQGSEWRDGTALYYALHLVDMQRFPMFGLQDRMEFIYAMSYTTLLIEFSLASLIWLPRARPYVLASGAALHLGIEYSMNIPLFAYTMISTYLTFVRESWVEGLVAWLKAKVLRFAISVPASTKLPGSAWGLMRSLDVFNLLHPGDAPDGAWDKATLGRVIWRFPIVWALILIPMMVAILIEPSILFLSLTCIVWPSLVALSVPLVAGVSAASIASAEAQLEADLIPAPRKPKRSPTRAH